MARTARPRPLIDNGDGTHSVPLNQGLFALIDSKHAEKVGRYRWTLHKVKKHRYAANAAMRDGKKAWTTLHRFILGLTDPKVHVDHRDGDGLNNLESNIRQCTPAQNTHNKRSRPAQHKGVIKSKGKGWEARIRFEGRKLALGRYNSPENAARAYDQAARELFGEFAFLNFPSDPTPPPEHSKLTDPDTARGSRCHSAKLDEIGVGLLKACLRSRWFTQHHLARTFGIAQSTVAEINTGVTWKHVA